MIECRGQEQQQGRSELEEHNRILTDRIGRLVADQKEACESLKKMESQREELQEQLRKRLEHRLQRLHQGDVLVGASQRMKQQLVTLHSHPQLQEIRHDEGPWEGRQ